MKHRLLSLVILALLLTPSTSGPQLRDPVPRFISGQSVTLLPDGRWLLLGGQRQTRFVPDAVVWDPRTQTSVPLAQGLRLPRGWHTATVVPDGTVVIIGGLTASGALTTSVERFNPATESFEVIPSGSVRARAFHTATLLTDGDVLLAGGVGPYGAALDDADLLNVRSGLGTVVPGSLVTGRAHHEAALRPDGTVVLWGGADSQGVTLGDGEIYDPVQRRFSRVAVRPGDGSADPPRLEASSPADGTIDVPTDVILALRFSQPLAVETVNPTTVFLSGPNGLEAAGVIAAESGRLAFITPDVPLTAGAIYTLSVNGPMDQMGRLFPLTAVRFSTLSKAAGESAGGTREEGPATDRSPGRQDEQQLPAERDEWEWDGERREGRPYSRWQSLPPLQAAAGVTALAGQVLRLNGEPLVDVTLRIDGNSTRTDAAGRFLLAALPGRHRLVIDGRAANGPGRTYGVFEVGVTLAPNVTTALDYTIWLPRLDTAHAVTMPSPTNSDVVVTTPRLPDLELRIPAGTVTRDHEGEVATQISITPIPLDRTPFPLPRGVNVPIYFTIQPGGAYLYNRAHAKARLIYPNLRKEPAGTRFTFWRYESDDRGWFVYGLGTVTEDGRQIVPDPVIGIYEFTGAMAAPPGFAPPEGAPPGDPGGDPPGTPPGDPPGTPPGDPPGNPPGAPPPPGDPPGRTPGAPPAAGDPVDLSTGLFVLRKTDLVLPDVIPAVLTRTYRPRDTVMRPFGLGATHPYEMFLVGDKGPYTYLDLILADGGRIHYNRISPGTGYADAVYEHIGTPTWFYKSRIVWSASAFGWELTLTDGTVYSFPPGDLATAPVQAALVGIHDRNGNALTLTRNVTRTQLLSIRTQNGRSIEFTYDGSNRITQAKDHGGRTVTYSYDGAGRLSTVTDPIGGVTEYTYDASNRMTTLKDARGIVFLTNDYDSTGKVIRQTHADGTTYQFAYTLDGSGKVTQTDVTNPRGYVRRVTFNAAGYPLTDTRALGTSLTQTRTYIRQAGSNFVTSLTDALGRQTDYSYDPMGRILSTTRLAGTPNAVTTTATYEPTFGQIATITDPLNHTTSFAYDGKGNRTSVTNALGQQTTMTYNAAGQPLTITTPAGMTAFAYELGDLIKVTDPTGNVTQRFVDAVGRLAGLTNPIGVRTRYDYDALNRLTRVTDGLGGVTQFSYDANGSLLSVVDARNNATTYAYNSMDRLQTATDPLSRMASYAYDGNGNPVTATDRKGQVRSRTYDALDRVTEVIYADNSTTTYTWDAGNRVTQVVDSMSGTITWTYDLLDRPTQETTPQGTVSYTYDAAGRRTSMTVAGQPDVSYSYDAANRLTTITQGTNVVSIAYDSAGRRTSLTLPNGVVTEYGHDAASRLTGLTYKNGPVTLGTLTYGYDGDGNRRQVGGTWARTGLPQPLAAATYDAANRALAFGGATLTHDFNGNPISDGAATYVWDARDRLSGLTAAGMTASFQYDAVGRRLGKMVNGTTTTVLHDGLDAVQETTGTTVRNILTGLRIDEYLSHASTSAETRYALADALGSTVALVDASGAVVTEYTYEPFGATTATGAPSENRAQYTGRENDGTGLYYYRARYYHPQVQRFLSEDPILAPMSVASAIRGGCSGASGSVWLLPLFLKATSADMPQLLNQYAYVMNNPLKRRDPHGLIPEAACQIGCGFTVIVFCSIACDSLFIGVPPAAPFMVPAYISCNVACNAATLPFCNSICASK